LVVLNILVFIGIALYVASISEIIIDHIKHVKRQKEMLKNETGFEYRINNRRESENKNGKDRK
jgi:hypothetical protein